MQEAFRDSNGAIHPHVATDGVEAMAFLRSEQDVARRSHDFARPVDRSFGTAGTSSVSVSPQGQLRESCKRTRKPVGDWANGRYERNR
jgi:hypothetical protein